MRETDDIERLFQESFEGFEVTPPASVKAAIDKEVKRKPGLIWWLSVLFVVLIATAGYFIINTKSAQKNTAKIASAQQMADSEKNTADHQTPENKIETKKHVKTEDLSKNNPSEKERTLQKEKAPVNSSSFNQAKNKNTPLTKSAKNNRGEKPTVKTNVVKNSTKQKNNPNRKTNTSDKNKPSIHSTQAASAGENPTPASDPKSTGNENPKSTDNSLEAANVDTKTKNPEDSTQTAASTSASDSIKNSANNTAPDSGKDDKDKNSGKNWTLSYYAGPQFDLWKTTTQEEDLKLKPSLRTSLEISRNLPMNFSVSTGAGYNKFQEKYSLNYIQSIDSVYLGPDSIPIYDQQNPDSIIGYNYIEIYEKDTVKGTRSNTFSTTAISIPIHLRRTFELTDNWVVMTDLGVTFNFYKSTKDSSSDPLSPDPVTNNFGLNASMRLHAGYKMENWLFTLGVNGSVYLKTPVMYDGLSNKRYYISPQIGVHYIF